MVKVARRIEVAGRSVEWSVEAQDGNTAVAILTEMIAMSGMADAQADSLLESPVAPLVPPTQEPPKPLSPERQESRSGGSAQRMPMTLVCDQRPGKRFTTAEAAKVAKCSAWAVSLAVKNNRPVKGLMFRRDSAQTPARSAGGDDTEEPGGERSKPNTQKRWRPRDPDFSRRSEGIIPDYQELRGRTRGEADGDPMPVNPARIQSNDQPAPRT